MTRDYLGPVTIALYEESRNPAHVEVNVYVGRNIGSRGHAGKITMRLDEWEDLADDYRNQRKSWVLTVYPAEKEPPLTQG